MAIECASFLQVDFSIKRLPVDFPHETGDVQNWETNTKII